MKKIESERLTMRFWTLDDAEDCFKYSTDERVGPPGGWKTHETIEDSIKSIKEYYLLPETYTICFKEDPELRLIGSINLTIGKRSPIAGFTDQDAEIGYWLGYEHWGKGYATEAVKRMTRYAFQELGMTKVWGRHYISNPSSGNVMKKAGYKHLYDEEEKDAVTGEMVMVSVLCIEKEAWEAENEAK